MTIVNSNTDTHSGLLVTGNGDGLDIELELIGGTTLRMSAAGDELGAWPIDECHIEPLSGRQGAFRLRVDHDDAVFTPTDPIGFRSFVSRVTGAEPSELPEESSEEPAGVTTPGDEALVSGADDPVAFLFGPSTPPPPPIGTPIVEEPDGGLSPVAGRPPSESAVIESHDGDVFDFGGSSPDDEHWNDVESDSVEVDAMEAAGGVDTISPEAGSETPEWESPEVEDEPTDADDDEWSVDAEPQIHVTEDDEPAPEMDLSEAAERHSIRADEPEIDFQVDEDEDQGAGRGLPGGSAFDRLSAAIGSITSGRSADIEGDDGDADDDFSFGPNQVAEEVMASQRSLRDKRQKSAARGARLRIAGIVVGVLAVIAIFAYLTPRAIEFVQNYESDIEPPPALPVSETTIVTTTTPVVDEAAGGETSSTAPTDGSGTTVFDLPAPEFVTRWDAAGGTVDEVLEFDAFPIVGPFEERFTPYVAMVGVVLPDGRLDDFSIVIDPTGPAEYDRMGIQALGVAIATVDPVRSPDGRAALLGQLGFNVRQPLLEGVDGSVETGGIHYTLVYDPDAVTLTLTVAAAG